MTKAVFYDTWAWRETAFADSKAGKSLLEEYGPDGPAEIHTSILALAEYGSSLARTETVGPDQAAEEVRRIEAKTRRIHPLEIEDVYAAIKVHPDLRKAAANASLADALMLCQARRLRLAFITGDSAFTGQDGVPQEWIKKR